jgi:hypothetical protein
MLSLFEQRTWPPRVQAPASTARSNIRVDLGARMRGMWR